MTRTASKSRLRTGDAVKEAKRECLELHSIEMEKAFIFGQRYESTLNSKPFRMTGGVISFIDSNNIINNTDGSLDLSQMEGYLEQLFRYGSSEKLGLCGTTALLAIQRLVRKNSQYNIETGIKEYGMNVTRLVSPFGTLVLKTHPLFTQAAGGFSGAVSPDGWVLALDMENIKYRYFAGDDTRYEKDLQTNGLDGMKSGYLSECGLEVHHPQSHMLIKGLRTGVVDA